MFFGVQECRSFRFAQECRQKFWLMLAKLQGDVCEHLSELLNS